MLSLSLFFGVLAAGAVLPGLPTVPFSARDGDEPWRLSSFEAIVVDEAFADATNEKGMTLIPPTLLEFAETFASDLQDVLGHDVDVEVGPSGGDGKLFMTLGNESDFLDVAGRETAEGYAINIEEQGLTITGASSLGAWWGTRTVIQQLLLGDGSIPAGVIEDSPGWGERGMMVRLHSLDEMMQY